MPGGHDQLFKDLIRSFPGDFLSLTAPDLLSQLDPGSLDFRPAEIFIDLPQGAQRHLDLVARAPTRSGEPEAVLLNVEIELRYRSTIPPRLWGYNRQLHLRYGLPVHTFVLYLRGGPPGVRANVYTESSLGWEVCRFRYRSLGLSGAPAEEYLARPEPLAWALAALMRWPAGDRYAQRRACLDRLAQVRNLGGAKSFLLFNCVATYLELDGRAQEVYKALLAEHGYEEDQAMVMTWAEKFEAEAIKRGIEKGREEGRQEGRREGWQEGMRELLLRQLRCRFELLPADVRQRIDAIESTAELERLAERVLSAKSLAELGLA
jgi:hypothetical protein